MTSGGRPQQIRKNADNDDGHDEDDRLVLLPLSLSLSLKLCLSAFLILCFELFLSFFLSRFLLSFLSALLSFFLSFFNQAGLGTKSWSSRLQKTPKPGHRRGTPLGPN